MYACVCLCVYVYVHVYVYVYVSVYVWGGSPVRDASCHSLSHDVLGHHCCMFCQFDSQMLVSVSLCSCCMVPAKHASMPSHASLPTCPDHLPPGFPFSLKKQSCQETYVSPCVNVDMCICVYVNICQETDAPPLCICVYLYKTKMVNLSSWLSLSVSSLSASSLLPWQELYLVMFF